MKLKNYAECSKKIIEKVYNDKHNKEEEIIQLKTVIKDMRSLFQEYKHDNNETISVVFCAVIHFATVVFLKLQIVIFAEIL